MLGYVSGIVNHKINDKLLLMVGSFGLEIQVPCESLFQINQTVSLYLYMHWHQENGPSLYGFLNPLDKTAFLLALDCSGIGPKVGLAIIADLGATDFLRAIYKEDSKFLSKVSGIGAKKAEQIMVQLKHKVAHLITNGAITFGDHDDMIDWKTLYQALESLNYSRHEIAVAVQHLKQKALPQASFDILLRQALSFLSKQSV
jgi:holliday junction DNA helicase RuvA